MAKLKVTQLKSICDCKEPQKRTIKALGLGGRAASQSTMTRRRFAA